MVAPNWKGLNWKRYVDPIGYGWDQFGKRRPSYAAQIYFRFRRRLPLTLGYDDDQFDDNGYYKSDDGTAGQCRDLGPAAVQIRVGKPLSAVPAIKDPTVRHFKGVSRPYCRGGLRLSSLVSTSSASLFSGM